MMKAFFHNLPIIDYLANLAAKHIWLIFLLALFLRLIILLPYYSGDVNNHIAWGKSLVEEGLNGFYQRDFGSQNIAFPTYGPIGMLPFALSYFFFDVTTKLVWNLNLTFPLFPSNLVYVFNFENQNMLAAFLKFPALIGDLLAGLFIYLFAKKIFKFKNAAIFPLFYLFNPSVFYLSANWGQIDTLPIAFVLGAFYFLFKDKPMMATGFIVLGLLTKQTVVLLLPLFLIIFFLRFSLAKIVKVTVVATFLFWLLYLPFFLGKPLESFSFYFQTFGYVSDRVTENAFNLWFFLFTHENPFDFTTFFGLSFRLWGLIIFGALSLPALILVFKKRDSKMTVLAGGYLILLAFLVLTRMHERYLALLMPFLLLSSGLNPLFGVGYGVISVTHIVNLYNGFFQPNLPFLTKLLENLLFLRFLVVINFAVFIYLLAKIIQDLGFVLGKRKNEKT